MPKTKRRILLLSAVALLLAAAILAGMATNWFGFYGAATKLLLAGKKTLTASSFTACASIHAAGYDIGIDLQGQINTHQREITLVGRYAGRSTVQFAIYKGFLIQRTGFGKYTSRDIHAELEQLFNRAEKNRDIDWEMLLQTVSETLYEQYGDRLNFDEINSCLLSACRLYNNPRWLRQTAGLTVEDNVYHFCPDAYEAIQDTVSCFAPVFRDPADHAALTSDLSQESLESMAPEVICTVDQGYLTHAALTATYHDLPLSLELTFSQIGSTDLDFDALSDILARAS